MRLEGSSILLLLYLVHIPYVGGRPTQIDDLPNSLHRYRAEMQTLPASPTIHHDDTVSAFTTAPSLTKRSTWLADLGRGWVAYINTVQSFMPAQIAAAALTNFYISAYNHVLNIQTGRLPDQYYACELGNIRLEFSGDNPVPWDFVLAFIRKMIKMVGRGDSRGNSIIYTFTCPRVGQSG